MDKEETWIDNIEEVLIYSNTQDDEGAYTKDFIDFHSIKSAVIYEKRSKIIMYDDRKQDVLTIRCHEYIDYYERLIKDEAWLILDLSGFEIQIKFK